MKGRQAMKETQIQMREKREESPSHEGVMNARGLKRTLAKEEPEGSPAWRGQCGGRVRMEGFGISMAGGGWD